MVADHTATLRALEARWRAALLARDKDAICALLHPEFRLVGVRQSGEAMSIDVEHWIGALDRMDIAAVEMNVLDAVGTDDTIIGTLDACWKVRYLGQTIDERVFVTDVWVRAGDDWQVIRRHTSFIPERKPGR
jgi:ketosteroid isomerase-like protein